MKDAVNLKRNIFFCVKAEEEERIFRDMLLNQNGVVK